MSLTVTPTPEERKAAIQKEGLSRAIDQLHHYIPYLANEADAILMHPDFWQSLMKSYAPRSGEQEYDEEGQGDSQLQFQGWTVYLSRDIEEGEVRLVI